jgi:hypothetical protein
VGRKNAVTAVAGDENAVGKSPANSPKTNALRRLRRFYSVTLLSAALVRKVPGLLAVTAVNAVQSSGLEAASDPPMRARLSIFRPQALDHFGDKKHDANSEATPADLAPVPHPIRPVYPNRRSRRRTDHYNASPRRQPETSKRLPKPPVSCAKRLVIARFPRQRTYADPE